MLGYLKKYWYLVTLDLALTAVRRFFRVYIPLISTKAIIDDVLLQGHYDQLGFYLLLIVGMFTVNSIVSFAIRYIHSFTSQKVFFVLRNELFTSLQEKSFSFYDRVQTGQLMSRVTNDVRSMQWMMSMWVSSFLNIFISYVTVLGLLLSIDYQLTLLSLIPAPFVLLMSYRYNRIVF